MMQIDVDLTAEESDLLAQCVVLLRQVQRDMTHARLEVGRACQEIYVSRTGRGFSERGTSILLADYLNRQSGETCKPGRLITVYQVVRLLGGGDAGQLGWAVLFEFYPLVRRKPEWSVSPGHEQSGPELFASCRQLGWTVKRANSEVSTLIGRSPRHESAGLKANAEDWYATMATSDARDVLDVIRNVVRVHPDREALEEMLSKVFRLRPAKI